MSRKPRSKPVGAALLAVGALGVLGSVVWRYVQRAKANDTDKAEGPDQSVAKSPSRKVCRPSFTQNPLLSVSFPPSLDADKLFMATVEDLLRNIQGVYALYALIYAPSSNVPAHLRDFKGHLLPYSNAEGRAMLARALKCQCHVEVMIVDDKHSMCLSETRVIDLDAYLNRLEQLARVVDLLIIANVPGIVAESQISSTQFQNALKNHSLSQRSNLVIMHATSWSDLAQKLGAQRNAWN